jgi:hypothetical protein
VHDVYLGTRAIAVCQGERRILAQAVTGYAVALANLREWLAATPTRLRLRVWLSGSLCRPFLVTPVPGIRSTAEMQRVAEALAPQLTGLDGDCRVWVDNGEPQNTRIAAAVQQASLDALHRAVEEVAAKDCVLTIAPWWSELLRAALRREPALSALAAQDCDSLTLLAGRGTGFEVAVTLTPVTDRDTADAALARLLVSAHVTVDEYLVGRLAPLREDAVTAPLQLALAPLLELSR